MKVRTRLWVQFTEMSETVGTSDVDGYQALDNKGIYSLSHTHTHTHVCSYVSGPHAQRRSRRWPTPPVCCPHGRPLRHHSSLLPVGRTCKHPHTHTHTEREREREARERINLCVSVCLRSARARQWGLWCSSWLLLEQVVGRQTPQRQQRQQFMTRRPHPMASTVRTHTHAHTHSLYLTL